MPNHHTLSEIPLEVPSTTFVKILQSSRLEIELRIYWLSTLYPTNVRTALSTILNLPGSINSCCIENSDYIFLHSTNNRPRCLSAHRKLLWQDFSWSNFQTSHLASFKSSGSFFITQDIWSSLRLARSSFTFFDESFTGISNFPMLNVWC